MADRALVYNGGAGYFGSFYPLANGHMGNSLSLTPALSHWERGTCPVGKKQAGRLFYSPLLSSLLNLLDQLKDKAGACLAGASNIVAAWIH